MRKSTVTGLMLALGLGSSISVNAAVILVGNAAPGVQAADEITASTTWTADNVYRLQDQIYVKNGATLTIQPGTLIASTPTVNGSGSLAITRGSKIIARGTCDSPIIFTSTNDVATWVRGDPKTGTWRAAANEWGNITIMGKGYISNTKNGPVTNTSTFNANNVSAMEGLTAQVVLDPNTHYGGGDDDDDSGSLSYVTIRYGGRVLGLGNELNGLSLGGIGRATDIDHIEIMNNVDDGIEIWGGTVNLKYLSIWNIGDDSFDIDQGWRGKAQFGLIVQGYSVDAAQGSGIGDNLIEFDGAEKADAQPVTTAAIYNFTSIGQPVTGAGDHGIEWRDGARGQFRNCIFLDLGDKLSRNGITDGEGSIGYGFGGTLTFPQVWTTAYTTFSLINAPGDPSLYYTSQSAGDAAIGQGFLSEITDSVFFRNLNNAYAGAAPNEGSDAVGVTVAGGSAPLKGNIVAAYGGAGNPNLNMPITTLNRGGPVVLQGGTHVMIPVTGLDPRAANAAVSSNAMAPDDGFFTPAGYRGAFSPDENWLCGWSASDAFGMLITPRGACITCEPPLTCAEDLTGNGTTDVDDLLQLINAWGSCTCPEDLTGNGEVDVDDLLQLINAWGDCPV